MRGDPLRVLMRGDIWVVEFDPTVGREQAGVRPGLVVTNDRHNRLNTGLVGFVPITSRQRDWSSYIEIGGPDTGLAVTSYVTADQVWTMSVRRVRRRIGHVDAAVMDRVSVQLRRVFDL